LLGLERDRSTQQDDAGQRKQKFHFECETRGG